MIAHTLPRKSCSIGRRLKWQWYKHPTSWALIVCAGVALGPIRLVAVKSLTNYQSTTPALASTRTLYTQGTRDQAGKAKACRSLTAPSILETSVSSTLLAFRATVRASNGSNLAESNSLVMVLAMVTPSPGPGGLPRAERYEARAEVTVSFIRVVERERYRVSNTETERRTSIASGLWCSRV